MTKKENNEESEEIFFNLLFVLFHVTKFSICPHTIFGYIVFLSKKKTTVSEQQTD